MKLWASGEQVRLFFNLLTRNMRRVEGDLPERVTNVTFSRDNDNPMAFDVELTIKEFPVRKLHDTLCDGCRVVLPETYSKDSPAHYSTNASKPKR